MSAEDRKRQDEINYLNNMMNANPSITMKENEPVAEFAKRALIEIERLTQQKEA